MSRRISMVEIFLCFWNGQFCCCFLPIWWWEFRGKRAGGIHWSIIRVALHTYANCGIGLSVDAFFASCITCVTLRTTLQQKFPKSVKHYDKNQDLPEEFQVVEVQLLGGEQLNMIMLIFLFISAAFAQDYCGISPSHTLCQYSVSYWLLSDLNGL